MTLLVMCAVASLTTPSVLTRVEPKWPVLPELRDGGPVVLQVVVDASGAVADVHVLRSLPSYERAAVDAVRQWKFAPATRHGSPVPIVHFITLKPARR